MKKKRTKCLVAVMLTAAVTAVSFLPHTQLSRSSLLTEYMGSKVVFATSYQPDIDKAKEHLKELEDRQKEAEARLKELEAGKADLTAYIQELDHEQAYAYEELMRLEEEIAECEALLVTTGEEHRRKMENMRLII